MTGHGLAALNRAITSPIGEKVPLRLSLLWFEEVSCWRMAQWRAFPALMAVSFFKRGRVLGDF